MSLLSGYRMEFTKKDEKTREDMRKEVKRFD